MKVILNISAERAEALAELGFEDVGKQVEAFYSAGHRIRTELASINSIYRYISKHEAYDNSKKLKMMIGHCDNMISPETNAYFFSLDTAYGHRLSNIKHCAEFIYNDEAKEYNSGMTEQIHISINFLTEEAVKHF